MYQKTFIQSNIVCHLASFLYNSQRKDICNATWIEPYRTKSLEITFLVDNCPTSITVQTRLFFVSLMFYRRLGLENTSMVD